MKQQILLQYFNGRYVEEEFKGKYFSDKITSLRISPSGFADKAASVGGSKGQVSDEILKYSSR